MSKFAMVFVLFLGACGMEPASKWDDKRGRFISTDQLKQEQRAKEREQDKRLDRLEHGDFK